MDILIKQLIIVQLMADNVDIFVRAGMRVYAILSIVPAKKNDLDKADAIYHTLVLGLNTVRKCH